jgi:hypothetical protein
MQKQATNARQIAAHPDKVIYWEHLRRQNENVDPRPIAPADDISHKEIGLDETGDVGTDTYDLADLPPMLTVGTSESEPELFGALDEESGDDGGGDHFIPKEDEDDGENGGDLHEADMKAVFQTLMDSRKAAKMKTKAGKAKKEKVSAFSLRD